MVLLKFLSHNYLFSLFLFVPSSVGSAASVSNVLSCDYNLLMRVLFPTSFLRKDVPRKSGD